MPDWQIGVYIPSVIKTLNYQQELNFFNKTCPIDTQSVMELVHEVVFGLVPSVLEKDIYDFSKSIRNIQKSTWKKSEWEEYENFYDMACEIIDEHSYCFGLSSLGTACYFLANNENKILEKMKNVDPNGDLQYVTINNTGRKVTYV